jgi:quercetin dioxygenase-like cupin family protein
MAWGEAKAWIAGDSNEALYQKLLDDATDAPQRNAGRKKVVRPDEMPWEMARQGLLKHLINEDMNTRMETVDAYMQIIPPGSRSGKHRHLAEECLYVLEGRGYDLHQDCDVEITDTYFWKPQDEVKRFEWEAGDVIYIPPNTIHQHFNASPDRPVRPDLGDQSHLQAVRAERSRADRGCAGIRPVGDAWRRGDPAVPAGGLTVGNCQPSSSRSSVIWGRLTSKGRASGPSRCIRISSMCWTNSSSASSLRKRPRRVERTM